MEEINWKKKENRQLIAAFLSLKTEDEAVCFLRDIMTEKEIQEFSSRLETARLLTQNVQYNTITEKTGLSSTTIARISKWLKGPLGGYRLILSRLAHHHNPSLVKKGLISNT